MLTVRSIAENIAEAIAFTYIGETNGQNSEVHVRISSGRPNRPKLYCANPGGIPNAGIEKSTPGLQFLD